MNCLIVDDNKMARTVLRHKVSAIDFLHLVGECSDVIQATNILNKQNVDLLLLDVQMPKISGIDFLKSVTNRPLVILITSRPDYAVEAFEYNVVDFILKPVKEERFLKAIMRAKEIYDSKLKIIKPGKEYFFFREKGVVTKLKIDDILYVRAMGDYINIHTPDKKYTVHYTLNDIEKKLPTENFFRVHRSYIAALDKIETIEDNTAYIYQTSIPVSETQRPELLARLNLLL